MSLYNPYLFPFGPGQQATASPFAPNIDDSYEIESPAPSTNPAAPSRRGTQGANVPVYAEVAQPPQPTYGRPQKIAVSAKSAIASMILGTISVVSFFLGLSIFPAIGAIIAGHFGLSRIKRSAGALTGKGMAVTGLITGYTGLVLSLIIIGLFVNLVMNRPSRQRVAGRDRTDAQVGALIEEDETLKAKIAASESVLSTVEKKLTGASPNTAHGNSPEAIVLAEQFNADIQVFNKNGMPVSEHVQSMKEFTYATHCELHKDRVAYMIRVHGSDRSFSGTKAALKELCFITASFRLRKSYPHSNHLAVCVRDSSGTISMQYGSLGSMHPQSELVRDSLVHFYAADDDELIGLSPAELHSFPNQTLVGPNLNRNSNHNVATDISPPFRESLYPPPRRPGTSTSSRASKTGELSQEEKLIQRLAEAPSSGLRQSSPPLPLFAGTTLELDPEKYAPLILDASRPPGLKSDTPSQIQVAEFAPNGQQLAVGSKHGDLLCYSLSKPKLEVVPSLKTVPVTALAYSVDAKELYAAHFDGNVISFSIGDSLASDKVKDLLSFGIPTNAIVVSRDGTFLIGSDQRYLKWQSTTNTGEISQSLQAKFKLVKVMLDQTGTGVLYSDDHHLTRFDLTTRQQEEVTSWTGYQQVPADFSPAARLIAIVDSSKIHLRDFKQRQLVQTFSNPTGISSLQFTPTGDRLIVGGEGIITVWDVKNIRLLATYKVDSPFDMLVRDISADGKFMAAQAHKHSPILYVLPLPDALASSQTPTSVTPTQPDTIAKTNPLPEAFQPTELASADTNTTPGNKRPDKKSTTAFDGGLQASSLPEEFSTTPIAQTNPLNPSPQTVPSSPPTAPTIDPTIKQLPVTKHRFAVFNKLPQGTEPIAFAPGGQSLLAAKGENTFLLFNLEQNTKRKIQAEQLGAISAMTYSRDGNTVYVGTKSGKLFALEIGTAGKITSQQELAGHQGEVTSLILGMNGKFIVSAGRDYRMVWQQLSKDGKVRELSLPGSPIVQLHEIPGQPIVLAGDGVQFKRVNLRTGQVEPDEHLAEVLRLGGQISPNCKLIASVYSLQIKIRDFAHGETLAMLEMNELVHSMHFTPDAKYLLAVGREKVVVFNPREIKAIAHFVLPQGGNIHQLTLSPDGKRFAGYSDSQGEVLYVLSLAELETLK